MTFAGILAGGTGSRMETATMPKQFLRVAGVPILIRTLRSFLAVSDIDVAVVSMNMDWEQTYRDLLEEFDIDQSRVVLTAGGDSRFTSLMNIVRKAAEVAEQRGGSSEDVIITHDCARIFVNERIIRDNLKAVHDYDMVTTSIPVIDTILQSEDGKSSNVVPDRSKLWADQGPQTFIIQRFLDYAEKIPEDELPNYIEAGKLYLANGCRIGIVKGERFNFKVTNDIDLQYAEFLIGGGFIK